MKKEESKKTTKKPVTKTAAKKTTTKKTTTTKTPTIKKVETKKENIKIEEKKEVKATKKVSSNKQTIETMFDTNYKTIITIVIITLLIIGIAIALASIVKKNQKNNTTNTSEVTIQYDEILLSDLLEQSNNTYYVLVYSKDDNNLNTYNTYLTNYKTKANALRVYYSIIENGFNKKYISDTKNYFVSNIDDLKIVNTTLLKVNGKKVVEAYDEKDSIISKLKNIIK